MARKKCPQGVFCIENITLIFLIIIVGIGYLIYVNLKNKQQNKNVFYTMNQPTSMPHGGFNFNIPSSGHSSERFISGKRDGVAKEDRGSTTVTSKPATFAMGARN